MIYTSNAILVIATMYLRDSKTEGVNVRNTKYSFTAVAAWRLALTSLLNFKTVEIILLPVLTASSGMIGTSLVHTQ